jgi:hypothetical protein
MVEVSSVRRKIPILKPMRNYSTNPNRGEAPGKNENFAREGNRTTKGRAALWGKPQAVVGEIRCFENAENHRFL